MYINIAGLSRMKAEEELAHLIDAYRQEPEANDQYIEKYFWLPVEEGQTRIELLYPFNDESKKVLEKRYTEFINKTVSILSLDIATVKDEFFKRMESIGKVNNAELNDIFNIAFSAIKDALITH